MKIEIEGPVRCELAQGAVNLLLRGQAIEVLFSGAETTPLPPTLHQVRVTQETAAAQAGHYCIESVEGRMRLRARSVQVHRDVAAAVFAAVPPTPVPLRTRAGWSVLLSVLGIPGVGRLILRQRGAA